MPDLPIVCTLDGGPEAFEQRKAQWNAVVAAAISRESTDGGVTLSYDHDAALTEELARLCAAEFTCCSFFSFTMTVDPAGVRLSVTAPAEAQDVITELFAKVPIHGGVQ